MPEERLFEIELFHSAARIRVETRGRKIDDYTVVLLVRVEDEWRTVRVYDNHLGSHHMHRYNRSGGKQPPARFHAGSTNEALAAAIAHLKAHYEAIIAAWKS